jgi:hypothetical protein
MSVAMAFPRRVFPFLARTGETTDRVIWFLVAIWVLLALGATIVIGALVWCFMHATHSLYAVFQVNPWTFKVGCN